MVIGSYLLRQVKTCFKVMQLLFSIDCITFSNDDAIYFGAFSGARADQMQICKAFHNAPILQRWPCGGGPAAAALRRRPCDLQLEQVYTCSNAF